MHAPPAWARPRNVAVAIAAYLLTHLLVRLWMGPTLGIDDAEQTLFAQQWLLNYRLRAPPLFTWALVALSDVINPGVLLLSLMRYVLLGMIAGFTYLTARYLIADLRLAALATFSVSAIYVFGFYSHHDLTHTTVLSAFLAASWYVFVRLSERPVLPWYLALGLTFGLGLLGKWNFIIFAAALPMACLLFPATRGLVFNWRIIPAALVTVAIAAPSALYAWHVGPAPGDEMDALLGRHALHPLVGMLRGTVDLASAVLLYPQPFLAMFLLAFGAAAWRGWRTVGTASPEPQPAPVPDVRLVGATIAIAIGLHWLLVPLAGATSFDERLMQPALMVLPIYLFMLVERGGIDPVMVRRYGQALAGLALIVLAVRIGTAVAGADYCRGSCRTFAPFDQLAAELRKQGYQGHGTIVAPDFNVGGNLRAQFPAARIMETGYPTRVWPPPSGQGQCLAVWMGTGQTAARWRGEVEKYLAGELGIPADAPRREGTITAPMRGSTTRLYHLHYALYDAPQQNCR